MRRGEIRGVHDVFNATAPPVLQRIVQDAMAVGAKRGRRIERTVMPFAGAHEMMMTGTASFNTRCRRRPGARRSPAT